MCKKEREQEESREEMKRQYKFIRYRETREGARKKETKRARRE